MQTDLNKFPYYDDFSVDKKFHKILFNPKRAVQARELTQIQTILQNQIANLGNHVFKNGSKVLGAEAAINMNAKKVKVNPSYASVDIDFSLLVGLEFTGQTSGAKGKFLKHVPATDTTLDYIVYNPLNGVEFTATEVLQFSNGTLVQNTTVPSDSTIYTIQRGVYYVDGYFVLVTDQTIVVDADSSTPTASIGLQVVEDIINHYDDSSLLDQAQGTPNFSAPGADRYFIDLVLTTKAYEYSAKDFIEISRVNNGILEVNKKDPQYGPIEDAVARRTYETHGNYVVDPFLIQTKEHRGADATKVTIALDPGVAYIEGYEYRTIANTYFDVPRARDTFQTSDQEVTANYENYVIIKDVVGNFDPTEMITVDIHNVAAGSINVTNLTNYNLTKIGTARVKQIDYYSGADAGPYTYRLYLFDINVTSGTFAAAESITTYNGTSALTRSSNVDNASKVGGVSGGDAFLSGATFNTLVFPFAQDNIETVLNSLDQVDLGYTFKKTFKSVAFTSGSATILTDLNSEKFFGQGSGVLSNSISKEFYKVVVTAAGTSPFTVGQVLIMTTGGRSITAPSVAAGSKGTITLNANTATNFTADVIATVNGDQVSTKTKSLVTATHATITPAAKISLGISDVYRVVSVTSTVNGDVTSRFSLDNGQRDSHYDHAAINLISGQTLPTGTLTIVFEYFTHTGDGYFSVDSYAIPYEDIPSYTSSTGVTYKLKNCLDFRPRKKDVKNASGGTITISGSEFIGQKIPNVDSFVTSSYRYYLGRVDRIVLTKENGIGYVQGKPSENPAAPNVPDNSMTLYTLYYPPYTESPNDIEKNFIDNSRYTMRDIAGIDTRVKQLQYYTQLSLLEQQANDQSIVDGGIDRFKNGILVDSFKGHAVGDVFRFDYTCAIDKEQGILRAPFNKNAYGLVQDDILGLEKTGDVITLPYTKTVFINQPIATGWSPINPYDVPDWVGEVKLNPSTDFWFDTNQLPDVIANLNGSNDSWTVNDTPRVISTTWNDWQTNWTGVSFQGLVFAGLQQVTTQRQSRTGTQTIMSSEVITQDLGNKIVSADVIPFIRSRNVLFNAKNVKPTTRFYSYFDNVNVSTYVTPATYVKLNNTNKFTEATETTDSTITFSGGAVGRVIASRNGAVHVEVVSGTIAVGNTVTDGVLTSTVTSVTTPANLTSDERGTVAGIFNIPSTETVRFRTGQRNFIVSDNPSGEKAVSNSFAETQYFAQGTLNTQQRTILSVRQPTIVTRAVSDTRVVQTVTQVTPIVAPGPDPLAQSFFVDSRVYPDGVFLESVDVFFKQKDLNIPATVELRSMVNGYPSNSEVLTFSRTVLQPEDILVSEDASVATNVKFQSPVYVAPGEYAIVLLSNSAVHEVFTATIGASKIGSDEKVSSQPYIGSLFKSQNASTWTATQEEDLVFVLYKCEFDTNSEGYVDLRLPDLGSAVDVDVFQLNAQVMLPNSAAFGSFYRYDQIDTVFEPIIENENVELISRISVDGDETNFIYRHTMVSGNKDVSPVIDLSRSSAILVSNNINNLSSLETGKTGGDASARYITRVVELNLGFTSDTLAVTFDCSRPSNASVKVYYKTISEYEGTVFDDKNWVEMIQTTSNPVSASRNVYNEMTFRPNTVNYDINQFTKFVVKIVMLSDNPAKIPLIKNLRVIAAS